MILTDLSEEAAKRITQKNNPQGLEENREVARWGGKIAKNTRVNLEEELGESVVTKNNQLNYNYEKILK